MALTLKSAEFKEKGNIPDKYSCKGDNISPPLVWKGIPKNTRSFALIMDDMDSSDELFTHWMIFNLPRESEKLPAGIPGQEMLSDGTIQGKNDDGDIGYIGPCPKSGNIHRYRFILYALDDELPKNDLLEHTNTNIIHHSRYKWFF